MAAISLGITQAGRALRIDTPLGDDVLMLRAVSGQEAISQLFRFQLELSSEDEAIDFDAIIGKNVTIHVQTVDGERLWNGFISRFSQGGHDERFTHYRAEMVPWLWFLTRTADCRIFQEKTAPDIIKKIFEDLGFKEFKLRLYKKYRKRDYCVQYRETDFNFVSRLMEEEGIYYFFEFDNKGPQHTLILADDAAAHKPCEGQPKVRCDMAAGGWQPDDIITEWRVEQEYRPSAWSHTDFNFETPSAPMMVTVKAKNGFELYDYPGIYANKADGDTLAKTRLEETLAFKNRVSGKSNCRCFVTGALVEVTDHYRKDMNQKWLLTAVYHQATMGATYHSGGDDEGFFYMNTFECVPASVPFRPARVTPKPSVQGCQTALVVGPKGEEIHTEKYGRVKVHFHWDREGRNEHSSCWVRVSQPWAGKGWGAVSIPRIDQEVIVDFLEGDPDQPIIVGRVYNAENMPPYALPEGAHNMGMKSKSIKGGGYNEISISDSNAAEGITVHAQHDMSTVVENNETVHIKNNRTETVDVDESITIGNNRVEKVGTNETVTIGANETTTIGANRKEQVGGNETIQISGNCNRTISKNDVSTVALTRTHSVGINEMINIGAAQELTVGGIQLVNVGLAQMVTVGLKHHLYAGDAVSLNSGGLMTLDAPDSISVSSKEIKIVAATTVSITCGASKIVLSPGSITIDSPSVKINS